MRIGVSIGIVLFSTMLLAVDATVATDDLAADHIRSKTKHRIDELQSHTPHQLFDRAVGNRTRFFLYLTDRPYTNPDYKNWQFFQAGDLTISGDETWGDPNTEAFQPIAKLRNSVPLTNTMDEPTGGTLLKPGEIREVDYDILQLNRLRVTGPSKITIPSRPLLILVNKIDFETGATLTFSGGPVLVLAQKVSSLELSEVRNNWDRTVMLNILDSLVSNEVRIALNADYKTKDNIAKSTGLVSMEDYLADGNGSDFIAMAYEWVGGPRGIELINRMSDAGLLRLYSNAASELQQAHLNRQRASTIMWAKVSTSLPVPRQDFAYPAELASVRTAILKDRQKLDHTLLRRVVGIKTRDGISRSVTVYVKGDSLENEIEPNTATLEIQSTQSHSVGILTKDPESVDQLRLYLRLRLSADPWTADLVGRRLSEDGEVLRGQFTRYVLNATGLPPGVLRANVNLDNDLLDMDLTISRALAGTFLAQLALPLGVPFTFSWTSIEDSGISGNGLTFRVSLQRNVNAGEFILVDGMVQNRSSRTIKIAYAKADDNFLAFDPPLVIKPSESKKLPIDQKPKRSWEIPLEAVTWPDIDPSSAALMFDIPDPNEVLQSILIENHLSVYDQTKDRHLQKVVLEVDYEVRANSGTIIKVPGEKVSLSPAGGQGNSATLRFIKPQSGAVVVIVSGNAFYDTEQVALKMKRFDTSAVNIGNDMLP